MAGAGGTSTLRIAAWIAVAMLAVGALAAYFRFRAPQAGSVRGPAAAPARAAGEEAPSGPAPIPFAPRIHPATPAEGPAGEPNAAAGTSASRSAPLPPGTPASTVLDRLGPLADSGDASAACRVGIELVRCAAPPVVSSTTRGPQVAGGACAGISPAQAQAGWSYLARAAAAGSEAAIRMSQSQGAAGVSPTECGR